MENQMLGDAALGSALCNVIFSLLIKNFKNFKKDQQMINFFKNYLELLL